MNVSIVDRHVGRDRQLRQGYLLALKQSDMRHPDAVFWRHLIRRNFIMHVRIAILTALNIPNPMRRKHAKVYRLVTWKPIRETSDGQSSGPDCRGDLLGNTGAGRNVRRTVAYAQGG